MGRCTIPLVGLGVAFAIITVLCELVVVGALRGVLQGVVVGFEKFVASTNKPFVTEGGPV